MVVIIVGFVVCVLLLSSKPFSSEAVTIPVRSLCVLWLCAVKHDASYYLPVAGILAHRCELIKCPVFCLSMCMFVVYVNTHVCVYTCMCVHMYVCTYM